MITASIQTTDTHTHARWQRVLHQYPRLQKGLQGLFFLLATPLLLAGSYWIQQQTQHSNVQKAASPSINSQQIALLLNLDDH